ncbi:MAG: ion transporter [Thermoplasmatota archaeon]
MPSLRTARARWHEILEAPVASNEPFSRNSVQAFVAVAVLASVAAFVLATDESFYRRHHLLISLVVLASFIVFLAEYILRLWSIVEEPRYSHPVRGRVQFALTPLMIIDLLVIFPAPLFLLSPENPGVRSLAVVVILRLVKLFRYSPAMQTLGRVLHAKRNDLLFALFVALALIVGSASVMFYIEHPVKGSPFTSIPASMWWSVETLTTVGYGDIVPATPLGRAVAGAIALLGVGMIALPAGILASGFSQELGRKGAAAKPPAVCPHCGKHLNGEP